MSGRYKFKDYKGCPGVTVLQTVFDLAGTMGVIFVSLTVPVIFACIFILILMYVP